MKKTYLLLILLLIPVSSAFQVNDFTVMQDGTEVEEVIYTEGNSSFYLNVTDEYNYTLGIYNGTDLIEESEMEMVDSANDSYEYFTELNVTDLQPGNRDLHVEASFDDGSTVVNRGIWMVGDEPVITGLDYRNSVKLGENNTVKVYAADSQHDSLDALLESFTDGEVYDMNLFQDGRVKGFMKNYSSQESGEKDFEARVEDPDGDVGAESFSFDVDDEETDSTDVNVTIEYACSVFLEDYKLPGNGTISMNTVGAFNKTMVNRGDLRTNLTVPGLNVSDEGSTPYTSGETGPIVKKYNGSHYPELETMENVSYDRKFNATYDPGYYAAHSSFNWSCENEGDIINHSVSISRNFRILNSTQESGAGDDPGNETTNQTYPSNSSEYDEQEETNDTIEGDNDAPGQTEVEVPDPVPDPVPEPIPMLSIDVEPTRNEFNGSRGNFIPVELNVTNHANSSIGGLNIEPQLAGRSGWEVRNAQISNLSGGETVQRDVFIRPSEEAEIGYYVIPVTAENAENRLDIDYINLRVHKESFESRVAITESPSSLTIEEGSAQELPVLVRNPGEETLTNVTATLQNAEDCGISTSTSIPELGPNQTEAINMVFNTTSDVQECNATLIVSSDERAYAFSDISFQKAAEGIVNPEQRPPLIAIGWTAMLVAYAVVRRRLDLDSAAVNIPLILLIVGEVVIAIYLGVDAGLIQTEVLPF